MNFFPKNEKYPKIQKILTKIIPQIIKKSRKSFKFKLKFLEKLTFEKK